MGSRLVSFPAARIFGVAMEVQITSRTVVDGIWREVGQIYDLPPHRCKELLDAGRAEPVRSAEPEAAVEKAAENVAKSAPKRGRRAKS